MADLYPPALRTRHSDDSPYPNILYPHLMAHSASSNSSEDDPHTEPHSPPPSSKLDHHAPKPDAKPQATFLTKLYAYLFFFFFLFLHQVPLSLSSLLERPENHHMIRWDSAGEHIIVERPEQLALHVLPSIYRQSRFASFSRQLNVRLLSFPSLFLPSCPSFLYTDLWLHAQS